MRKKSITISAAVVLLAASCTSVQKSRSAKTLDVYGSGVVHIPVVADLKVSETKASGIAVGNSGEYPELVKQRALAEAIENSNADILVEPAYKSTTNGTTVTYTVTGYPANYRNFRNAVPGDTSLMKIGYVQKATATEHVPVAKKKKGAGAVLGTLSGIALLILLIALI